MKKLHFIHSMICLGLASWGGLVFPAQQVFGQRYCEIVYSKDYIDFYVYNTTGVNQCSSKWWSHLTEKKLTRELAANYVFLNGPRIWLIDKLQTQPLSSDKVSFEGSKLPMVASFHSNFQALLKRHGPFVDYEVNRAQQYFFNKGRTIFEVVSPKGEVYVLHSISLKHHHQSLESLASLSKRVHLPSGWHFKTGTLNDELVLKAKNNYIHVVMDEFDNTYQLVGEDPLK